MFHQSFKNFLINFFDRANAVVETVVYPTGYELYYDGTLFLTRVQIAVKTRQIGQEFLSEVSYTSAAYKAMFNMSMNSDQIWFNVSKGDEHYTLSAAKIVKFLQLISIIELQD